MAGYGTYTSPINRMGAISQVGQGIQNQRLQREEVPLRQGLLATQAHAQTLNNLSQEQQIQMVDKKLKETDFAANAYEALLAPDDTTMLGIIQQRMPDFLAAAQQEQATPDAMRERLNGLVQRGAALGVIKLPREKPEPNLPSLIQEAQFFYPEDPAAQREFAERRTRGGSLKPEEVAARETAKQVGAAEGQAQAAEIEGSKANIEQQERAKKALDEAKAEEIKNKAAKRYSSIVFEDIGRAMEIVENNPIFTTGLVGGQLLNNLGGTEASDLNALLDTVESGIAFDRLQAMRDSSPTGGALGQVSELEITLLKAALGSVRQSQSGDALNRNLKRLQEIYSEIIHGQPGPPVEETPAANIDDILIEDLDRLSLEELKALRDANRQWPL